MRRQRTHRATPTGAFVVCIALFLAGPVVGTASAQDESATQTRDRDQARSDEQAPQGDNLHRRIRDRIESEPGLQTLERDQLRRHLGECETLGLDDAEISAIFSDSEPLQKQIRTQARVLAMAREGLPVEPVTQKLQEGRRKGISDEMLDAVCARMEESVRVANRYMEQARDAGVTPGDRGMERRRTAEMAKHVFNGLGESDMDQLRERARIRLRDGSCTTDDLTAATETTAKLRAMGIERERAARVVGDALQHGYTAREIRQLSWMIMTAKTHGGEQNDVLDTIERGIRNQDQLAEMVREMYQRGWMGPADGHGGRGGRYGAGDAGGHRHGQDDGGQSGSDGRGGQTGGGGGQDSRP